MAGMLFTRAPDGRPSRFFPWLAVTLCLTAGFATLAVAWESPQTAPHPAFGWPTINDPSRGFTGGTLPAHWQPIPERALPATITGLEHVATGPAGGRGTGIAAFGSLVVVPGYSGDAKVYDVSDPADPRLLSSLDLTPGRDADFIAYPDGRLILVMASDHGRVPVWDLTDPENPVHVTDLRPPHRSHNVAVVPGTPILYNANTRGDTHAVNRGRTAELATGETEIYDLTDPENPQVRVWRNGFGCHDITFHVDRANDKYRAYCAGVQMTQIWDVEDPLNPRVLTNVPVHHGVAGAPSGEVELTAFSHLAMVNHDASILIVGDETGGGGLPPGCDAHVDAGAATVSGPIGNFWFYDVTDESSPVLRGSFSPGKNAYPVDPLGTCTVHFGRLVEGRDLLVAGAYSFGTILVDFADPAAPRLVDRYDQGSSTWDAWSYNGWVFTGDLSRGMDVLTFR